ncbi:hypothetical protein BXZ70DRAFT_1008282 [Cristinia sonorae]|uniref:DUF6593 domain-containing protein n=1 Tax=Cristinia sonorae TaxID=1940300 RepID=A0A8K0UNQ5_9AGAR|nr:hypothetical protein BXZ70DRAFT_1008282 [Cristinia sonorae]
MNLHLVPNDPSKAVLMSDDGVVQYRITTRRKHLFCTPVCQIFRSPAPSRPPTEDRLVAEIEWKRWSHPIVRSDVFDGTMLEMEVREFLYKLGRKFSTTRYFLGSDDKEYCWKDIKGVAQILTARESKANVARFSYQTSRADHFPTQKRYFLQIEPTTLDIDMLVITFIIMEKRRREREAHPDGDEAPFESGFDGAVAA